MIPMKSSNRILIVQSIRPDVVSLKMAYEAARDGFLVWYEPTRLASAPNEIPAHLRKIYERARKQGMREMMEYSPPSPATAPTELDGQFSDAWTLCYEDGRLFGEFYASMFLKKVVAGE
jgi:hypothetical protein